MKAGAVGNIVFDAVRLDLGGRRIIEDLSFEVPAGQFVCVVGPSGCGKTTLLRLVAGLLYTSGGEVRYDSRPAPRTTGLR